MEDNLEKQRFIAQYWGQPIMLRMEMVYSGYPPEPDHEEEVIDIVDGNTIEYYLKGHAIPFFKSLKDITDEDALHIAKMSFVDTEEGRKLWTPENGRDDVLFTDFSGQLSRCPGRNNGAGIDHLPYRGKAIGAGKIEVFVALQKEGPALRVVDRKALIYLYLACI